MFNGCYELEKLDISNMSIKENADVSNIVSWCDKLEIIKAPKDLTGDIIFVLDIYNGDWYIDENNDMSIDEEERKTKYVTLKTDTEGMSYTYIKQERSLQEESNADYSVLMPGVYFKRMLSGIGTVRHIYWTNTDLSKEKGKIVRVDCEGAPVYARNINSNIELYTTAKKVYFHQDSSAMFSKLHYLEDVEFFTDERIDTSRCINYREMFYECNNIKSLDLSGWDVTNAKTFESMFAGVNKAEIINISGWDTPNLEITYQMFKGCKALKSLDVSSMNTSKIKGDGAGYMFFECESLESLDLSSWDVSGFTCLNYMFSGCKSLTNINTKGWNVSNVHDSAGMFRGCMALSYIDLSDWDLSKLINDEYNMFEGCTSLVKIKAPKKNIGACKIFPDKRLGN
jgi:surface protein